MDMGRGIEWAKTVQGNWKVKSMYIMSIFLQKQNWIALYKLYNRLLSLQICSFFLYSGVCEIESQLLISGGNRGWKSLITDSGSVMLVRPLTVYQRISARQSDHCSVVNKHGMNPPQLFPPSLSPLLVCPGYNRPLVLFHCG